MSKNFYKMNLQEKQEFTKNFINKELQKHNIKELPIKFSGRMTRTLGQFEQKAIKTNNGWKKVAPSQFKISNKMLKEATIKSIKLVLIHEIAHYLTDYLYYKDLKYAQSHNNNFKKVCKIIGTHGTSVNKNYKKVV